MRKRVRLPAIHGPAAKLAKASDFIPTSQVRVLPRLPSKGATSRYAPGQGAARLVLGLVAGSNGLACDGYGLTIHFACNACDLAGRIKAAHLQDRLGDIEIIVESTGSLAPSESWRALSGGTPAGG